MDEQPITRFFTETVPITDGRERAKMEVRKKLMHMLKAGDRGMKQYGYRITKEAYDVKYYRGVKYMVLSAFVESDAFVPSRFTEWLEGRGWQKPQVIDDFLQEYSRRHPEWRESLMNPS